MMTKTRAVALFAAGAALLSLSGCFALEAPDNDLVAIRRDGTELELALCRDLVVKRILVTEFANGQESSVIDWYDTSTMQAGDVVNTRNLGSESGVGFDFQPSGWIRVLYSNESKTAPQSAIGYFDIPDGGVPTQAWLRPGGGETDTPCEQPST